jgi:hypothetical protein
MPFVIFSTKFARCTKFNAHSEKQTQNLNLGILTGRQFGEILVLPFASFKKAGRLSTAPFERCW